MDETVENLILDLLDAERAAILEGAFDRLARLAARKEALLVQCQSELRSSRVQLRRIARYVDRNQRLLGAALDGVRDATMRLKALRNVRETLVTYDSQGQMARVASGPPGFEHKA